MSFSVYAANKKITGGVMQIRRDADNLWFCFYPQIANNPDKKNNFDWQSGISVKFSNDEIGDLIRTIRTKGKFSFVHTFESKVSTSGSFAYFEIADPSGKQTKSGFGFSVNKNPNTIKVYVSLGGAENLMEYLKTYLREYWAKDMQLDIERSNEYRSKKSSTAKSGAANSTAPKTANETEDTDELTSESDIDF